MSFTKLKRKIIIKEEFYFLLKDIDIVKIDRYFNMEEIKKHADLNMIEEQSESITKLDELGIKTIKQEPITTIINKEKTFLQTYMSMVTKERLQPENTTPCFGCRRKFSSFPIGIPIKYHPSIYSNTLYNRRDRELTVKERERLEPQQPNKIIRQEYFDIDGIVCSFNCIYLAIEENNIVYKDTPQLVPMLYKSFFGKFPSDKINKSPSWRMREEYGGPLSDKEYVANLQTIKITDTHQTTKLYNPIARIYKVLEKQ